VKISLHSPLMWLRWIARNSKRLAVLLVGGAGVLLLATDRKWLGIGGLCAGAAALAVLIPRVQGWVAQRVNPARCEES